MNPNPQSGAVSSRAPLVVAMAQMDVAPGDAARNAARMLDRIAAAREQGVDVLVFPEMCLPGYLLGDAWERPAFLRDCEAWTARIAEATAPGDIVVIFGTVITDWEAKGEDGRVRRYNGFVAAQGGRALTQPGLNRPYGIKTLLPNYREFEETRHFYDARKLASETGVSLESFLEPFPLEIRGETWRAGVVLCEDAWDDDYAQKPLEVLAGKGCDFVLNLSCSPFTRGKNQKRHRVFSQRARTLGVPLFYVNCVGLQNNGKTLFTFDGRSAAYENRGALVAEMPAQEEAMWSLRLERKQGKAVIAGAVLAQDEGKHGALWREKERLREIHAALRYGARKFLESIACNKVVVGVSGGIDSAVAAALYREILPPENLLLINMPGRFNSATTKELARALAANLGCLYAEVGIEDGLAVTLSQLNGLEAASRDGHIRTQLHIDGAAFENVQARDRGSRLLAAVAAAFGGVFSCNANKAELTVGYGTLYGDIAGFLAVLGDLWKGDVYALGGFLNEEVYRRTVIPDGIFTLTPSAELGEHQNVDEGKGDPLNYPYHDRLFSSWVQRWNRATPEENLEAYLDGSLAKNLGLSSAVDPKKLFPTPRDFIADLERWWDLYNRTGAVKRVQAPPILAVSSRAFGYDHREFLGKPAYTQRYLELKKTALGEKDGPSAVEQLKLKPQSPPSAAIARNETVILPPPPLEAPPKIEASIPLHPSPKPEAVAPSPEPAVAAPAKLQPEKAKEAIPLPRAATPAPEPVKEAAATPKSPPEGRSAVVLGATGAVGRNVVRELLRSSAFAKVTTIGRRPLEMRNTPPGRLTQHVVDVFDPASYEALLAGHSDAFCVFGIGQPSQASPEEFRRTDLDCVVDFAGACFRQDIGHFTLMTSVGADSLSRSRYLRLKGEVEDKVRAIAFGRLTIFRPSLLVTPTNRYGFTQGLLLSLFPLLDWALLGPLRKYRSIRVEDLARLMVRNAEREGQGVRVFQGTR